MYTLLVNFYANININTVFMTIVKYFIIAHVNKSSSVHWQMIQYSQRVVGYLTRYALLAIELSFDKK